MDRPLVACVLAGGTGTRLYPASRSDRPKQLLTLGGDRSLLERTIERARIADAIFVLTTEALADPIRERVPADVEVLVEPERKDTGPALVYAAYRLCERYRNAHGAEIDEAGGEDTGDGATDGGDSERQGDGATEPVMLCLPSDHYLRGDFEAPARRAARVAAETGGLVTIGVEPDRAAPGYGYIKPGTEHDAYATVEAFREKPDSGAAARYVHHGYRWNTGIFAWTPTALLTAARDSPLAPLVTALEEDDPEAGFEAIEPANVDSAVLEPAAETGTVYTVTAGFEWDDLGSWDALERVLEGDEDDNVVLGDVTAIDAADNVLAGGDGAHVSVVGVEGLVVAAYGDRVLVAPKREAQRVRDVVAALRDRGRF